MLNGYLLQKEGLASRTLRTLGLSHSPPYAWSGMPMEEEMRENEVETEAWGTWSLPLYSPWSTALKAFSRNVDLVHCRGTQCEVSRGQCWDATVKFLHPNTRLWTPMVF